MSTILTFVTAALPTSAVNRFLSTCHYDVIDFSIFALVRKSSQRLDEIDVPGTEAPVQDFDSGFIKASEDELWDKHREYIEESTRDSGTAFNGSMIALLDSESEKNQTVVLLYKGGQGSAKWRVPFKWAAVPQIHLPKEESVLLRPDMIGKDGVLDLPKFMKECGFAPIDK